MKEMEILEQSYKEAKRLRSAIKDEGYMMVLEMKSGAREIAENVTFSAQDNSIVFSLRDKSKAEARWVERIMISKEPHEVIRMLHGEL